MFADQARIWVEGGRGGSGCVSFRREAHVPRGGPDGGDGGRGGDVVLVADPSRRDLASLKQSPHQRARKGAHGQGKQRHGARGEDRIVLVPPGTQVEGLEGESYDLIEPGQRAIVAPGGLGGHGNKRFANSTRQAPRFAEHGLDGASGWIELQLKLLADAGLVGLPNAGKSSLLGRLTRAAPKVAGYPFTTTAPVLGTLEAPDRLLVLADIPGLIEGAAQGAGLGHEFLAHVERCRMLIHVVAIDSGDPVEEADADERYATVRAEIAEYGHGLEALPELVVVSKSDLVPQDLIDEAVTALRENLGDGVVDVLATSAATGAGLEALGLAIAVSVPDPGELPSGATAEPEFETEHRVYRPNGEGGYTVLAEDDGAYRVEGRGIELLFARHDLSNAEALAYVEQRLHEIGVISALRSAGFEAGDEVRVGEEAFELHP
ncbi:MAG: GTPase ObgE [Solirubrobacterales bacterium]